MNELWLAFFCCNNWWSSRRFEFLKASFEIVARLMFNFVCIWWAKLHSWKARRTAYESMRLAVLEWSIHEKRVLADPVPEKKRFSLHGIIFCFVPQRHDYTHGHNEGAAKLDHWIGHWGIFVAFFLQCFATSRIGVCGSPFAFPLATHTNRRIFSHPRYLILGFFLCMEENYLIS